MSGVHTPELMIFLAVLLLLPDSALDVPGDQMPCLPLPMYTTQWGQSTRLLSLVWMPVVYHLLLHAGHK